MFLQQNAIRWIAQFAATPGGGPHFLFRNFILSLLLQTIHFKQFYVVASKATILKVCAEPLGLIARERHFAELVK